MMCAAAGFPPATIFRGSPGPGERRIGRISWMRKKTDASYRIAVIAGDGIGKEVVPEGQRVLEAAGRKFGFSIRWDEKPWSCDYYAKHGRMMPQDGLAQIR